MNPKIDKVLAKKIVDGDVELMSIEEIVSRLGVSRSTLERWIRKERSLGSQSILGDMIDKTNFPRPDLYIGASPKWMKTTVVDWLQKQSIT
jgi:predicted DNA-binding transcriptional regulator AlpA